MVHQTIMSFTTRRLRPSALQRFAQQKICRSSILGLFESQNETTKTLKSNPYPAEIAVKCGHVPGFLKGFLGFGNHDLGQFWFFRAPLGFKGFATSAAAEMVSHRGTKSVEELRNEVESASSIDQIKDIFRNFESDMDGSDTRVGLACLTVGQELSSRGDVPESVLEYARRALSILEKHDKNSIAFFTALHLISSTHYSMKQYSDSKGYLNRAIKLIERLEKVESEVDTKLVASAIHTKAGDVSTALGKLAEGLSHYSKALELKKEVTKHNQPELAVSYRQLAECYVTLMKFKEALPLCLEALRIHMKHFGENSSVVAADRRTLAAIHSGIGDNNKALTEITAAKNIYKYWEMESEVMDTELESCNVQMLLGKFEDANDTVGSLLEKTSEEDSKIRSTLLIYKGKALSNLKKFGEAKRMFKMATNILSTFEESDPIRVAEGYAEIALYYEMVDELEDAISLYKQAITLYGNCKENQHAAGSTEARLGWLLLLTGNLQESVTILEKAAGKLTESFGLGHYGLGYVYNNLGLAYKELERPQKSVELFTVARDILKKSFGSKHKDTMDAVQNLAKVHSILGSHEVALKLYEEVAEVLQSYGDVFQDDLDEANRRIKDLKTEIQKSSDLFLKKRRPEKKRKIINKKRGRTR